jgi:Phosphotransferase enzyme family
VKRLPLVGLSETHLQRVTEGGETLGGTSWYSHRIYKRIPARAGWLGKLSDDAKVREVALWSSGLLQRLPAGISTGVLHAATTEPDGMRMGTLIMRDLQGYRLRDGHGRPLRDPPVSPPGRLPTTVARILRGLAGMHAAFWEDRRLDDPDAGLMGPRDALLLLAPGRLAALVSDGETAPYIQLALSGWESFFALAAPIDAETLRQAIEAPERILRYLEAVPRTLVHGDVWGPNLGLLPGTRRAPRRGRRLLLLDWALATAGPCTYDVLWLSGTWHDLDPERLLAAYRPRLEHALWTRGQPLLAATWDTLVDAGYLRTALTCGEALARNAMSRDPGAGRRRLEGHVRWWAARAARAARRLELSETP